MLLHGILQWTYVVNYVICIFIIPTINLATSIKAILYDLDGVLIDTKNWHFRALNTAIGVHGITITEQEQKELYEALPTAEKLKLLTKHKGLRPDSYQTITEHKNLEFIRYFEDNYKLDEHKVELLETMQKHGFVQILCSNTTKSTVDSTLKALHIYKYFDHIITRQDIDMPKPHPEIYLRAIQIAQVHPSQALILEDSEHGLVAATASGANIMKITTVAEVNYSRVIQELGRYE